MYFTYIIRCEDNSLYTGISTDLNRRLDEHRSKSKKSAKYTAVHSAIKYEIAWKSNNKSEASKLEYNIKKLSKSQKENLITGFFTLEDLFWHKFDCLNYEEVDISKIIF